MNNKRGSIDLAKLAIYILKRIWIVIICAAIGFGAMYFRASKNPDTYTASGTMFVTNSNPNLVNYGYTSTNDINSAVSLVNIYSEVIKSETVMQRVLEYRIETVEEDGVEHDLLLGQKYPSLSAGYIRGSISMNSVNQTPMVRVSCTTSNAQLSADICNAVLQVAPAAIKEVVGAGEATPQDFATVPMVANARSEKQQGIIGGLAGAVLACGILLVLFLLNRKVEKPGELTDKYTPPILSYIRRDKGNNDNPGAFLLSENSEMDLVEGYAKLRMNLLYTLNEKKNNIVLVTSAISGEGKSTIAANLAVSFALSGKKLLLIDADMRRACQSDIFGYKQGIKGLSDVLMGTAELQDVIRRTQWKKLSVLPAGTMTINPCELLENPAMQKLLEKAEEKYGLILIDVPPINIVSDPLALSAQAAGALIVVRQNFSDHREIRRALISAEMTGLEILGFVFYGENLHQGKYYSRRAKNGYKYYNAYDIRRNKDDSDDIEKY